MIAEKPRYQPSSPPAAEGQGPNADPGPVGSDLKNIITSLGDDTMLWIRQETELAKAELTESAEKLTSNLIRLFSAAMMLGIGGALLFVSLIIGTGIALQAAGLPSQTAYLVATAGVGTLVLLAGATLYNKSKRMISAAELKPKRTAETLQETKDWANSKLK